MTQVLKALTDDFDRRMQMRRRMMDHLDITNRPDLADELMPFLRQTLTACNRCVDPEICETWIGNGNAGAPKFCRGRLSFEALADATAKVCVSA
ncbi:DUF6455 family protein [Flavimaricola marinus]|uniref:DUF6455 domain-containing protein n=1 Tax=Flavimaricola marinus TaxID=1819565 RepID=A0A238LAC5_9RHOB|nr:DUF6455 family protein [Flavimaricola marinus]SMY05906.1 hypothetical protein LOM8899_00027 [Flavimaricola marinus]